MRWDWCACLILFTSFYGTFRGFYRRGFELNEFVFCEGPRTAAAYLGLRGETRAFNPDVSSIAYAAGQRIDPLLPAPESLHDGIVYLEWRGEYSGPRFYGHLGMAGFSVRIDSVIQVRAPRASDCPAANKAANEPRVLFDTVAVLVEAWRFVRAPSAPVDSTRPKPHVRASLMLSPTIDLETAHVSDSVIRTLRQRGIPVVGMNHSMGSSERAKYALVELRASDKASVRVVFYSNWFTPINREGFGVFQSRTDTVHVRCRASRCTGS